MKIRLLFWAAILSLISGLLLWRNTRKYPTKSWMWRIGKAATEMGILFLSAVRLPGLLICWIGIWITRPIETPWIRATVGVIAGLILGTCATFAMEVILLLSVFSIDDITGETEGFLKNLRIARERNGERGVPAAA